MEGNGGNYSESVSAIVDAVQVGIRDVVADLLDTGDAPLEAFGHIAETIEFLARVMECSRADIPEPEQLRALSAAAIAFGQVFDGFESAVFVIRQFLLAVDEKLGRISSVQVRLVVIMRIARHCLTGLAFAARANIDLRMLNPVSQLPQEPAFERDIAVILDRVSKDSSPMAVVYIDIDNLKQINDRENHAFGDGALRGFADAARLEIQEGAVLIYHLHGDEFVLVLVGGAVAQSRLIIERIRLRSMRRNKDGDQLPVTFCAGTSVYPVDGRTSNELRDTADDRMQAEKRAKKVGRDIEGVASE